MNSFLRTVFVTVFATASLLLAQPNQAFAQTTADEEAAIKKVIISEGDAWVRHDLQAWVDAWVDSPQSAVANTSGPGTLSYRKGFAEMKQIEEKRAVTPPTRTLDSRDDWHIRVVGNMAWARHTQHYSLLTTNTQYMGVDLKVLEKINGQWKISTSSFIGDFKNASPPMKSNY